jgi:hypothetical protein
MTGRRRAAGRWWVAALVLGATLGLGACGGSQPSSTTSRAERCRTWQPLPGGHDCVARCLECGLGDYGPCAASCQGLGQQGLAADWARPGGGLQLGRGGAPGAAPGLAAPARPAAGEASAGAGDADDDDLDLDMRPAASGALELDLSRLLAGQSSPEAVALVLATHREQIRSEAVARRAVQRLGLAQSAGYASSDAEATERVLRAVRARRRGASAVIDVSIVDAIDPVLASQICNAIMDAQLERTLELRLEDRRRRGEPADPSAVPNDVRVLDRCRPIKPKPTWGFGF